MTIRQELTDKLLNDILNIDGNSGAKEFIREYYNQLYDISGMKGVSIRTLVDGELSYHSYFEGPSIIAPELNVSSNKSAKDVLDKVLDKIYALQEIGATEIIVGMRSKNMWHVDFCPPNYYSGIYSFSGIDDCQNYWVFNELNKISLISSIKIAS